jgi:carboxypeptidase Taq
MSAYDKLMAFQRQTEALAQVAGRLGWDQETVMPRGAAEQRSEEMGAMEGILHARRTDPRIADWLAAAEPADEVAAAQLRHIARSHARTVKVPGALAEELARVTSVAQGIWAEARANDSVAAFLPVLETVVRLRREEAACLAQGGDLYDALIDDYEPGATAASIGAMFDRMRPRLVALRSAVLGAAYQPVPVQGHFGTEGQLRLARDIATAFGYDWSRGRLDIAVHPFSSGSGSDARITTRVVETDPFNCLYSTIHEVGHACYELGIDPDYRADARWGPASRWGYMKARAGFMKTSLAAAGPSPAGCSDRCASGSGPSVSGMRRCLLRGGQPGAVRLHPNRGG